MSEKESQRLVFLVKKFLANNRLELAELGDMIYLLKKYELWKFSRIVG